MFDEMPEQFYQFLAATSRATTAAAASLPIPLSFSLHHHGSFNAPTYPSPQPPSFDAPNYLLHHPQLPLLHLQQSSVAAIRNSTQHSKEETPLSSGLPHDARDDQRSLMLDEPIIPWSYDEVLALLRIRSSLDNTWFPDFTWENVSRKLAEVGFKRSAEKCKEKFEEETRNFNSSIINNCSNRNISNNYRLFGELEELCNNNNDDDNLNNNKNDNDHSHGDHHHQSPLISHHDQPDHPQPSLSQKNQTSNAHNNEDEHEDHEPEVKEDKKGESLGDNEEDTRNDNSMEEDEQSVDDSEKREENTKRAMRKRKRQKKFEMFKEFCEKIVNKMMAQQEELHYKILQDMAKRDEEKIAREETWKKQEIERIQKELEVRAHEQAISGDRQAKILHFLNKFSPNMLESQSLGETLENLIVKVPNNNTSCNSSILSQDSITAQPTSPCTNHDQNPCTLVTTYQGCPNIPTLSPNENLPLQSPNRLDTSKLALPMSSSSIDQTSQNPNALSSQNDSFRIPSLVSTHRSSRSDHTSTDATDPITDFRSLENQVDHKPIVGSGKDDTGRRWPRDEVLALINIRCSLFNNNNNNGDPHHDREGYAKGPLWERISQKMTELGYNRSAKRCKEKWENINKYFRKTKDLNKKRSIDSRTCPYFHQLSHLYSQGTLLGPTDRPANLPGSPENSSMEFSGAQGGCSAANGANTTIHVSQGNEVAVEVPGFDFEF